MSATNKTQHYNLPQFVAGDIPAWMTDVNNAMATIDGAIYDVASDEATVGESVAQLGSRVTTAENTVASLGTTVQSVQSDVAENTADIDTLEGNVNGLGTRVTGVEGRATALEGDVDTVEGNLTANNKRFQFAYDSTEQKYGYTLDGVFHPFEKSTDIHDALWEALQYSGIVEESDTVEEMLDALADYFPEMLIPVMTSNSTPSGLVTASGTYVTEEPYKALDGDEDTSWIGGAGSADTIGTGWLEYTFANEVTASKVRIKAGGGTNRVYAGVLSHVTLKTIDNNGVETTQLSNVDVTGAEFEAGKTFTFTNPANVKTVRISFGSKNLLNTSNQYYYLGLSELQLYV